MALACRDATRRAGRGARSPYAHVDPGPLWDVDRWTEAMSMALNRSGYRYFGGLAAFAVALSDLLGCAIHNPCHRVYSGRRAR